MSEVRDPGDHVGQLSADGKLMWDGQAWQPVGSSGPRPEPAAARTTSADARKSARTVLVAVSALVIGGVCGLVLGGASGRSSEHSLAVAYIGVLHANGRLVGDAFLNMGSECTGAAVDLSRCRAAAVSAQAATQKFLADLGRRSVPACLGPANQEVNAALVMYSEGVTEMIAGLDADNEAEITKGAELTNRGIPHLNHATDLINANPCK